MIFSGRLLEAFLALEETRRFNVAAQRCHVSASALSQMIGRLETQVGVKLFDRDTRNVSLTAEGELFAASARRIAAELGAAMSELKDRAAIQAGSVSIAAPPSLSAFWLPALLGAFRAEHPNIALKLRDVVSDRCLELVLHGHVDFGINARHGNELEFETLLRINERFYLICRDDDALAPNATVRLGQLRGRIFIHLARTGSMWQQIQEELRNATRDSGLEVEHFSTVAGLVSSGFGISVVPQFALPLCQRPGLSVIPLNDKRLIRPLFIVKRRGRSLSVAAQALWEFIVTRADVPRDSPGAAKRRKTAPVGKTVKATRVAKTAKSTNTPHTAKPAKTTKTAKTVKTTKTARAAKAA